MNARHPDAGGLSVPCAECDVRGWLGAATAGQFAFIGRLAMNGQLPTRTCHECDGTGQQVCAAPTQSGEGV